MPRQSIGLLSLAMDARTSDGVLWSEPRSGCLYANPLVYGDLLYSCSDSGVLKVYDARSGQIQQNQRLSSATTDFSASPVAAGGADLFRQRGSEVYVIKAGPQYELLAASRFAEITMASPAISENILYYRTRGHVVAVAE